jgi:hypothetical protein
MTAGRSFSADLKSRSLLKGSRRSGLLLRPIYDAIATRVRISNLARSHTIKCGKQEVNEFERRVRWTRQTAVLRGLISKRERAIWRLTDSARHRLKNIRRGLVVTFAVSNSGIFLWANAEDAVAYIDKESVDLICTSPPYPLLNPREYGNLPAANWVEWMLRLCEQWCNLLTETGSMMMNLGPCWKRACLPSNCISSASW